MKTLLQDIRYGLRQLVKMPGFTLTAILSLALGIGATTAVFSVVYSILMDPYPYASPDRMIHMRLLTPEGDLQGFGLTMGQWQIIRKSPCRRGRIPRRPMEPDRHWQRSARGCAGRLLDLQRVQLLRCPRFPRTRLTAVRRHRRPGPAARGRARLQVLAAPFQLRSGVLGKTIQMVRKNYTIVGVAAPRFAWGDGDVYLPKKITRDQTLGYYVGIRLKPGVSHEQANAALQPLIDAVPQRKRPSISRPATCGCTSWA